MADRELLIRIDEDTYKNIIKNGFIYDEDNEVVTHAIKNGTLLPDLVPIINADKAESEE